MAEFFNLVFGLLILYFIAKGFGKLFRAIGRASDRYEARRNPLPTKLDNGEMPYNFKHYFFSHSELEFFRILNSHLDAHRYTLFPKVRLADFIEVDRSVFKDWPWWNKIKSKHVDYLIWDLVESKIVLAIELDGKSHGSQKMIDRDDFVNELYDKVGLRLERVRVGSSFEEESQRIASII